MSDLKKEWLGITILVCTSLITGILWANPRKAPYISPMGSKISTGNDQIRVMVGEPDGRFTIGTTDGRRLLYGYPSEGSTSHTHFWVDDTVWGTYTTSAESVLAAPLTIPPHLEDSSIVCQWEIGGVRITQTLTPTYWAGRGMILIDYSYYNTDTVSHSVGHLIFLDTRINENDGAPIATEYGYFETSQEFLEPNIPYFWQAYEVSPFQPPEFLVGQGILIGGEAVPPNRLLYGYFYTYSDVVWDWEYVEEPYEDSCILMRWDPILVEAGEKMHFGTYYGIGTSDISVGQLSLSVSSPSELRVVECESYSPNPFPVNLIATSTIADSITDATAIIHLPDGMELVDGDTIVSTNPSIIRSGGMATASWNIQVNIHPEVDTSLCFQIEVTSPDLDSASTITSCLDLPPLTGRGPSITYLSPIDPCFACDTVGVLFRLQDPSGIVEENTILYINGEPHPILETPFITYSPPNLFAKIPWEYVAPADTMFLMLESENIFECLTQVEAPNTIVMDTFPPEVSELNPAPDSSVYIEHPVISALITDNCSGVNSDSLIITIQDTTILRVRDPGVRYSRNRLTIDTDSVGIGFDSGDTVEVCISRLIDRTETCGPNVGEEPVCWTFTVNLERPTATVISPDSGSFVSCDPAEIVILLQDEIGLDTSSVELWVNENLFTVADTNVGYYQDTLTLRYYPAADETVEVTLYAENTYGVGLEDTLYFSFIIDTTPPVFWQEVPESASVITSSDADISIHIADSLAGVDVDSLRAIIRSTVYEWAETVNIYQPFVSWERDSLVINLGEVGLTFGCQDTIQVTVFAQDSSTLCGYNSDSYTWEFSTPSEMPEVTAPEALPEFISCDSLPLPFLITESYGLDTTSISVLVEINSDSTILTVADEELLFRGDTLLVTVGDYSDNDNIRASILSLENVFGCSPDSLPSYSFTADLEGPEITPVYPLPDDVIVDESPVISFTVFDSVSGCDDSTVALFVNGVRYTLENGLINEEDSTFSLYCDSLGIEFIGGVEETLCVRAFDNAQGCGANLTDTCWNFQLEGEGPSVVLLYPPEESSIACDTITFLFQITDYQGIMWDSLRFVFHGDTLQVGMPGISISGDTLIFSPDSLPEDSFDIMFTQLMDSVYTMAESLPITFSFYRDITPPQVADYSPGDSEIVSWLLQPIMIYLSSDSSELNTDSVFIAIDSDTFWLADDGFSLQDTFLSFYPESAGIELPETVEVTVGLYDTPDFCYNYEELHWTFYVNPTGPQIVDYFPPSASIISCRPFQFWVVLEDTDGILADSLRLTVNDSTFWLSSPELEFYDDTLLLTLPERLLYELGESLSIEIPTLYDNWLNSSSGDTVNYIIDYQSPVFSLLEPGLGDTLTGIDPQIIFTLQDSTSGIDWSHLLIESASHSWTQDSSGVTISGDTIIFDIQESGLPLTGGEEISIEITAGDNPDLCPPNQIDTTINFFISSEGPQLFIIAPMDSTITHLPQQPIIIVGYDLEGIDTSSFIIEVDGEEHLAIVRDTTYVFIPQEDWEEGEHHINYYCDDILGNSSPEYSSTFTVDLTPPTVEEINPPPGSIERLTHLTLTFSDNISGVDSSSIEITLDGQAYYITSLGFDWNNNAIQIDLLDAGIELHQGDELSLCVTEACDFPPDYGSPNCIPETICTTYTIDVHRCHIYPIPFTPNEDGYNDYVFFEFPGFGLHSGNEIEIFNSEGYLVKKLLQRRLYQGKHLWMWDGKSDGGSSVAPGVYIYKVISQEEVICSGIISLMR